LLLLRPVVDVVVLALLKALLLLQSLMQLQM
jgi:hypothetical protein